MEVVQSEAEDIFIGSAAAMRGVRAGARALRDGRGGDGSELEVDEEPLERDVLAAQAELPPIPTTEEVGRPSGGA
jgi:hypothetical protein